MWIPFEVSALASELAQPEASAQIAKIGAALGAGVCVLGASLGIGRIGASANEGVARQPEASDQLRGGSVILAAFIEGVAFFGLVVSLMGMLDL